MYLYRNVLCYLICCSKRKGSHAQLLTPLIIDAGTPSMKPFKQLTYSHIEILWVQVPLLMFQKYRPKFLSTL